MALHSFLSVHEGKMAEKVDLRSLLYRTVMCLETLLVDYCKCGHHCAVPTFVLVSLLFLAA